MANLSNINGKFVVEQTTGYIGVGTTDPNFLIEAAGVNSEIALNSTSGSIYRVRSTSSDAFIITKNGVGDRLVIDGAGNSTFAGDVNVQNNATRIISLNYEDSVNSIISHSGNNFGLESLNVRGDTIRFYTDYDASSPKGNLTLTLDTSHNATFAGDVQLGGTTPTLNFNKTSSADILANIKVETDAGSGGKLTIQTKRNGNTALDALVINDDQNATFAGNVLIGTNINSSIGLQVNQSLGSGNAIGFFRNSAASGGNGLVVDVTNTPNTYIADFRIGNSSKVRIDSSGNVILNQATSRIYGGGTATGRFFLGNSDSKSYMMINGSAHTNPNLIYFVNDAAVTLTLNADNSATFAGDVNVGGGFLGVIDPVSGNFSGEIKVGGAGSSRRLLLKQDTVLEYLIGASGSGTILKFGTGTGAAERMRITSGGNVLMGNGSQAANSDGNLTLRDTQFVGLDFKSARTTGNIGGIRFYDTASDTVPEAQFLVEVDGSYNFYNGTNGAEKRMIITSGGNVLFGKTSTGLATAGIEAASSNTLRATKNNSAPVEFNRLGTSGDIVLFYANTGGVGSISVTQSSTYYNTSSDYRLKEDLQDFAGLDMVSKIPVYDFKWKTDESRSYGVMAHELQEVLPDAVDGDKDAEEMQGVDYSKIVPLLVKSIQELKADNDSLKARIETLENN